MHPEDGPDVTEVGSKAEWAAYKQGAARSCKTMIVGFFAGDGDYNDVGALLNIMSAEYPATWFYTVDTGHAQEVADRCNISSTPTVQVYQDAMLVKSAENPTRDEVEDLMEEFAKKY
eukprot:CAMPEP_0206136958 /NCGR_PEP_ID=MMETSP1473-20131121/2156_1 /ASSEMBLY_ACC=CAM_ASM_001109 /TAXON_ID=1461547 /ORGANISM="Stichococcus sp, Strain RCC1054" /LENGTH=116 /DNA_ID=CAMNT_0053529815 /DNA_START=1541 /DNA_END=1891 /DNA_ORIENTATION=+